MPDHSVHRASELAHDERLEILTQAREIGARAQDAKEDALIDEAFAAVRGGRG